MGLFDFLFAKKKYQDLADQAFQQQLKSEAKAIIIDVRSKSEFQREKIHQAQNIDVMTPTFKSRIDAFDREKTFFVYCQSGRRSARACRIMTQMGFEKVYNLKGGIISYTGKTV